MTVESHSHYYIKLITPEVNYFLSTNFGWICKGMPFDYRSIVSDKKEIERVEQLVHAHSPEVLLKQFKAYLSAKKLQVKTQ